MISGINASDMVFMQGVLAQITMPRCPKLSTVAMLFVLSSTMTMNKYLNEEK